MDSTFVRKDFYVAPPTTGASVEEWNNWLAEDRKQAISAKRRFTMSQKASSLDADMSVRKVGGVYKQVVAIGFVGEGEDSYHTEAIAKDDQEKDYILSTHEDKPRGLSHILAGNSIRKDRRNRRKAAKLARKLARLA